MSMGPGKYDAVATFARQLAKASGVVLVIVGGEKGHGFEVQLTRGEEPVSETLRLLAKTMRDAADQMERDARGMEV